MRQSPCNGMPSMINLLIVSFFIFFYFGTYIGDIYLNSYNKISTTNIVARITSCFSGLVKISVHYFIKANSNHFQNDR